MASETYTSDPTSRGYAEEAGVALTDGMAETMADRSLYNGRVAEGAPESRSLGELFSELSSDMSELLQKEVALAQAEMMGKVSKVASGAGMAVGGGMVAYVGLILLLIAVSFFLTQWMAFWVAAGIVAVVTLAIGLVLLQVGRSRIQNTTLTPEKTIDSLKQDAEWVKEQVK